VAETRPLLVSALDGVAVGRHGRRWGDAGVIATEVRDAGLATITARNSKGEALHEAALAAFGLALPPAPRRAASPDLAFIWSGPDQWLAYARPAPAAGMEAQLAPLAGLAAIVDQSHARTLLRIQGGRVRDALAKGVALDLHPRAFQAGDAAVTAVAHIGVHFWQLDDSSTYELAVPRGYALSFWHWLATAAAEYGLELTAPAA
jgi:sarcosine oxidase subunit gamma